MQDVEHRDFRLQSNGMDEVFVVATSGTLADQNAWIQVEFKDGALVVTAFSDKLSPFEGTHLGTIDKDGFLTGGSTR